MKSLTIRYTLLMSIMAIMLGIPFSCKQEAKVRQDHQFKKLFYADSDGITGADGIFSVPLKDGSSVFLLGDCFIGEVKNGSRDLSTPMLRNAFNVISPDQTSAQAITRGTLNNPETLMVPPPQYEGDTTYRWYWPGHGFVKDDILYVFALNLYNDPDGRIPSEKPEEEQDITDKMGEMMWAFRISQIDLLSFRLPDFQHLETRKADFDYLNHPIDLGNCILVDDEYVYIYGTHNLPFFSHVHVARVPLESEKFYTGWEFFTGHHWSSDISKSQPLNIDVSVSEQFSVFRYQEKYILLTMDRLGSEIFTYISDTPHGPFSQKTMIYNAPDAQQDPDGNLFAYNALAHPQYLENDELLVSYCLNSRRVRDVFDNVETYRAQFIRVPMEKIFSNAQCNP